MIVSILLASLIPVSIQTSRDSDYVRLVPSIVAAAVAAGVPADSPWADNRHLLVDLTSFALHGKSGMKALTSRARLGEVLGPAVIDRNRSDALRCAEHECWIEGGAVFLRLDSLQQTAFGSVEAFVTCLWNERRPSGDASIGMSQVRLRMARRDNRWMSIESVILLRS